MIMIAGNDDAISVTKHSRIGLLLQESRYQTNMGTPVMNASMSWHFFRGPHAINNAGGPTAVAAYNLQLKGRAEYQPLRDQCAKTTIITYLTKLSRKGPLDLQLY